MILIILIHVLSLVTSISKANILFKEDSDGQIVSRVELPEWNGFDKTFIWMKVKDPRSSRILRNIRPNDGIHNGNGILRSL